MENIFSWADWASFQNVFKAFDSTDILKSISTVVVTQGFIAIWCGLTCLYFFICMAFLVRGVLPLRRALRAARRELTSLDGQHGFTQGFEKYSQTIRSRRQLVYPWSEFVESLVFPEPGSNEVIKNTGEVSQYLNDSTVLCGHAFYYAISSRW